MAGRSTGANCPQQRLADPAFLGLAGEAVHEPVEATANDVFGGRLAARLDITAIHPHRGRARKPDPSVASRFWWKSGQVRAPTGGYYAAAVTA
jgi:hypothetical protein